MTEEQNLPVAERPKNALVNHLDRNASYYAAALSNKPYAWEPWKAAILADAIANPDIVLAAQQAPETVGACLAACANAGLLPGRTFDQFYLIPRNNRKLQRKELTFIIGYKGLTEMAYRHPRVHSVEAFCVYRDEPFSFDPGSGTLRHEWNPDIDRSDANIVAVYSRVELTTPDGMHVAPRPLFWPMTIAEVIKIRDRSQGFQRAQSKGTDFSPWITDFSKMVRKTALRGHLNGGSVPRQTNMIQVLSEEAREEVKGDVSDADFTVTDHSSAVGSDRLREAMGMDEKPSE